MNLHIQCNQRSFLDLHCYCWHFKLCDSCVAQYVAIPGTREDDAFSFPNDSLSIGIILDFMLKNASSGSIHDSFKQKKCTSKYDWYSKNEQGQVDNDRHIFVTLHYKLYQSLISLWMFIPKNNEKIIIQERITDWGDLDCTSPLPSRWAPWCALQCMSAAQNQIWIAQDQLVHHLCHEVMKDMDDIVLHQLVQINENTT